MDHDLNIDLADLELFLDNWLWEACWRENYFAVYGMMDGGGGSMMSQSSSMEALYSAQSLQAESVQPIYEPTPEELSENINDILDFLDTVLEEDNPVNKEGILEMKAVLEGWLDEIEL